MNYTSHTIERNLLAQIAYRKLENDQDAIRELNISLQGCETLEQFDEVVTYQVLAEVISPSDLTAKELSKAVWDLTDMIEIGAKLGELEA